MDDRRIQWVIAAGLAGCWSCDARSVSTPPGASENRGLSVRREGMLRTGVDVELFVTSVTPAGAHDTVVAVHGGPGLVSHAITQVEEFARYRYAAWWYLQRGLRPSSVPTAIEAYEIARYADDLAGVASAAASSQHGRGVLIVGFSWGALPTVVLASRGLVSVAGIVLVNPAAPTAAGSTADAISVAEGRDWAHALGEQFDYPAWQDCAALVRDSVAAPAATWLPACSEQAHSNTWRANREYDVTSAAAAITVPVLIVRGGLDPLSGARSFSQLLPNAELVEIPDCGHLVMSDDGCRRQTIEAIVAWRKRTRGSRRPLTGARPSRTRRAGRRLHHMRRTPIRRRAMQ